MTQLTNHQFSELLQRYLAQNLSEEELDEFLEAVADPRYQPEIEAALDADLRKELVNSIAGREREEKVWSSLLQKIEIPKAQTIQGKVRKMNVMWKWAAAAAVIIFMVGGLYWFNSKRTTNPTTETVLQDVKAPVINKAMITLANGQQIVLDSVHNGTLAEQGNISIIKKEDGQIAYEGAASSAAISYNTLSNPRGSKVISLTLSDGSKVWLNAASSLKYPTSFSGKERKVQITGEAYFEVAHNAAMPFKVDKEGMEVTVLGTHFNVNAYDDEPDMKVTLLQGRVKVTEGQNEVIITPGQQAIVTQALQLKIDDSADLDKVMAWKNGKFQFDSEDLETIMRQLSRWYDVDVEYNQKTDRHFTGIISRNATVSEVLKMLQMTGVMHFEVEGRKVIVTK